MPIYEYFCDSCGHEQEAIQKLSDAPLTDCESCGEAKLRRKISAAAFRLKGGGWYETDFKSGNRRNIIGDSSSGNGSDNGSSSGSSEGSGGSSEGSGKSAGKESSGKDSGSSTSKAASGA
ncbi:zinc ribbon domain-containing protein [Aquisalimonas lutea]|uniref:FmdB family zinc ribbon protein n=1 Tax=Aquisalimonas lutea TaxID=1327750 RepID=UPI0025B3104C|nr:zinc ribbon domain-containing protein [Aquisalimonas lutea]MDN3517162.1 zinc ribbon domain-containing protein [Aquisalimonas lutea]